MEFQYQLDDKTITFNSEISKNEISADVNGEKIHFTFKHIDPHIMSLMNEKVQQRIYFTRAKDGIHLYIEGEKYFLKTASATTEFASGGAGYAGVKGLVASPMPGTIIKFLVKESDVVCKDQGLVIVEAMKMENEIRSTIDAVVKKLNFKSGDAVDVGQPIIDLEEIIPESEQS